MKTGIQTNFPHKFIRDYGCFFLALLEWVHRDGHADYTTDDIIRLYDEAVARKLMREDCYVMDATGIYIMAGGVTKCVMTHTPKPTKRCIQQNVKPGYTHFTLYDEDDGAWDSLDPARKAATQYKVDSYRCLMEKIA